MVDIFIESGHNSSYLTSVLISLFFNNTYLEDMLLNKNTDDIKFVYLQELIKNEFINNIKNNKSIFSKSINKIRILSHFFGWLKEEHLFEETNPKDYVNFLLCNFDAYSLNKNKNTVVDITVNNNTSIKNECDKRFKDPIKLSKIFPLLTINVNKSTNKDSIEIEKHITLTYIINNDTIQIKWLFHSAICFDGKKYYSLIVSKKKWYFFSDNHLPAFISIDMSNLNTINKIKSEVCLVFYKTDF